MKKPKNSLELPYPTRTSCKIAKKLTCKVSRILFFKTKQDNKINKLNPMQGNNHAQPMATWLITSKLGYKLVY